MVDIYIYIVNGIINQLITWGAPSCNVPPLNMKFHPMADGPKINMSNTNQGVREIIIHRESLS